jgi:hypothetical protein
MRQCKRMKCSYLEWHILRYNNLSIALLWFHLQGTFRFLILKLRARILFLPRKRLGLALNYPRGSHTMNSACWAILRYVTVGKQMTQIIFTNIFWYAFDYNCSFIIRSMPNRNRRRISGIFDMTFRTKKNVIDGSQETALSFFRCSV